MAWSSILTAIINLFKAILPYLSGWLLARSQEQKRQAERSNEDLEEQLELELDSPRTRDDLLDKLRRNGL